MLAAHVSREQRIADLAIHGWEPVREAECDMRCYRGIYHRQLDVGFAVSRSVAGQHLTRICWIARYVDDRQERVYPQPCEWSEITDAVLDAIDARLAQL